ncbi:putative C2 domain, von Willebrand factor, type A, copine, C2 domain superfamily [Helianthus annuus]|nr:putative C2 domain, von Willebrand factor, type A, copine, C2 domain superfamily [Helianthus annuus]
MGNCFSGDGHGKFAVGGTSSAPNTHASNDAVDNFFSSRGHRGLFSQIELSLSASNLRDRDVLSKSDPLAVVYTKGKDGSLQELGRTEVVSNSLNPQWITKINVTYCFETVQTLLFRVYDVDTQVNGPEVKTLKLDDQQYLGECTCKLSQIVTDPKRSWTADLVTIAESTESTRPKKLGQLTVNAEEELISKTTVELTFRCSDLENKDFFSKSDCFLVISKYVRSGASGPTIPICRTEVLNNNLNPKWKPIFLNMSQVGNKDAPLIIECFNFNSNGKHDLLGKAQKSIAELEKLSSSKQGENLFLPVYIGKDHQSKVLKSQLFVDEFSESVRHSFLDYLLGGCEMNFMVAIDFTASNGNPRLPDSLHYVDHSGRPNAYQKAIQEVGDVLQFYDHDKEFPAWGFGGRPIDGPISHCFNLNGSSGNKPTVSGIQGIMNAYGQALSNVSLAGPTLFGPVINSAAKLASESVAADEHKYFVLLIITDGVITDQQETIDALVMASDLPLSVLIVGVGGADFKEMEILDADNGEKLHSSTGRVASRDIVQFVPFRDVQGGEISVVRSLLAELPSQFLTYMKNNDIQPKTKLPTT